MSHSEGETNGKLNRKAAKISKNNSNLNFSAFDWILHCHEEKLTHGNRS